MTFKKNTLFSGFAALAFAVALCLGPPAIHAQTSHQQATAQHAQKAPHTFTGKIVQLKNGHFALLMARGPKGRPEGHLLSHVKKAQEKKYIGKKVKVTGKLNMSDNTVSVTSIQRI